MGQIGAVALCWRPQAWCWVDVRRYSAAAPPSRCLSGLVLGQQQKHAKVSCGYPRFARSELRRPGEQRIVHGEPCPYPQMVSDHEQP